jgi:flagellar export protein FliJ
MADVLKHLQKLREHEKKQAQMDLAKAERAEETQAARLEENARTVKAVRKGTQEDDAAEVARYHAFRLRMEMIRRREVGRLQKRQDAVSSARDHLNDSVRQVRTLDKLIENREEEAAKEARKSEQNLMNELSIQGWWRKTG